MFHKVSFGSKALNMYNCASEENLFILNLIPAVDVFIWLPYN